MNFINARKTLTKTNRIRQRKPQLFDGKQGRVYALLQKMVLLKHNGEGIFFQSKVSCYYCYIFFSTSSGKLCQHEIFHHSNTIS